MDTYDIKDWRRFLKKLAEEKRDSQRREKLVFYLDAPDIDGFLYQSVVASRIALGFAGGPISLAVFKDCRPEFRFIADCMTGFSSSLCSDGAAAVTIPVDWFDQGSNAPVMSADETWSKRGFQDADLVMLPHMLELDMSLSEGLADGGPVAKIPLEKLTKLDPLGLEPERWFATVASVEAEGKASLIDHVIDRLGGQAVVLDGDERGTAARADQVDITGCDFETKTAAVAQARFHIGGDSPFTTLASAFGVPCGAVAVQDVGRRVWRQDDLMVGHGDLRCLPDLASELFHQDNRVGEFAESQLWNSIPLPWPKHEKPLVGIRPL